MTSSKSTEPHPGGPIPAPLQMKGTPVAGIHPGPAIAMWADTPRNWIATSRIVGRILRIITGQGRQPLRPLMAGTFPVFQRGFI